MTPPYDPAIHHLPEPDIKGLSDAGPVGVAPAAGGFDEDESLLRTADVAALFQVSSRTVSEWARRGRVPCLRTPGGQWRYPAEAIRQLLNRPEEQPSPWPVPSGPVPLDQALPA